MRKRSYYVKITSMKIGENPMPEWIVPLTHDLVRNLASLSQIEEYDVDYSPISFKYLVYLLSGSFQPANNTIEVTRVGYTQRVVDNKVVNIKFIMFPVYQQLSDYIFMIVEPTENSMPFRVFCFQLDELRRVVAYLESENDS
jgi:hypothetical protein